MFVVTIDLMDLIGIAIIGVLSLGLLVLLAYAWVADKLDERRRRKKKMKEEEE